MYLHNEYTDNYDDISLIGLLGDSMKLSAYKLMTESGNEIAVIHIEHDFNKPLKNSNVIIYSHGNSSDLGMMLTQYVALAENLKINILAYDYSGYGESTGTPTDINVLLDMKSIYK